MNEQDKTLYDFAEQVRRKALAIMAYPASGRDRTEDAGLAALDIMQLAMKMKTFAQGTGNARQSEPLRPRRPCRHAVGV